MSLETEAVFFTAIFALAIAVYIFSRASSKTLNQTLALFSLAIAVWMGGQALGGIFQDKAWVLLFTRVNLGAAVCAPSFYLHFILCLLGKDKKQGKLIICVYLLALVLIIFDFTPWFVKDVVPVFGIKFFPQAGWVYPYFALYVAAVFVLGFGELAFSLRKAAGECYKQLVYAFAASLLGFCGAVTLFLPVFKINFPILNHYLLPIVLLIMVYAIVKHNLLDITIMVNQGLVYSSLTVLFTGLYALAVLLTNYWFSNIIFLGPVFTSFLIVFMVVLIFQPVKDQIQKAADKLFYRGEYYYKKTIDNLSNENQKLFHSLLRADKLSAVGTMAAGMAHEIKNPLAVIKGMTQMLPGNITDSSFVGDYVEVVPRQLDRINRIIDNLLRVGKATKLEKKVINVNNTIVEVIEFYSSVAKKAGIKVDCQLAELPLILLDADQMQQALGNLVLNALQAMPGGGQLIVSSEQADDRIVIKIKDSGVGIASDKIEKIFDPFFSLKEEGTGLGLFMTFRILQEHKGAIEVTSSIGKGTEFSLWLPTKQ